MNDLENYKNILENIFKRNLSISITSNTNNCIGALNNKDNFDVFKNNFYERLKRLVHYFRNDEVIIDNIINTCKNIGSANGYKWSGYYSELVALDYWIQFDNIEEIKYGIKDKDKLWENSFAKIIGQTEVDIDLSLDLSFSKLFTDVKSLIPTHLELIDKLLYILKSKTRDSDYLIAADNLFEVEYLKMKKDLVAEIQNGKLISDLTDSINTHKTYHEQTLPCGIKLQFRIAYVKPDKNTVLTTSRSMNPYRLAIDYK